MMRKAAPDCLGLVNLPQDYIEPCLAIGRLMRVLDDWGAEAPITIL
jgi:DNA-binding transcriptional LysR family regulator